MVVLKCTQKGFAASVSVRVLKSPGWVPLAWSLLLASNAVGEASLTFFVGFCNAPISVI